MEKKCQKCNKRFYKKPSESRKFWSTRLYCSHSCANSVTAVHNLGDKANRFPKGHISWSKGIKGKNHPQWSRIEKICLECGKKFIIKNYRKTSAKYCSHQCSEKARDEGKTPLYRRIRDSKEYAIWRTAVFMRDDYTCQNCGGRSGNGKAVTLHADHIKPFSLYPELRFAINNGKTLCVECHKQTDTFGFSVWKNNFVASMQEA